ncbi:PH domain-containing protein [Halalkalibacter kiskunsagensis]|uniref:PH domain-containing protein n=1 Tax=Halalkalibacter kiskunsagensis TaxID=1548599 RepID=A0ABV6KA81_9BACI
MSNLKRLHVAAIFVSFVSALRSFLIPFIVSFFLGSSSESIGFFRFEYIWLAILLFIFISGIANWLTFRYRINAGELYIQRGIFVKKKRYIQQQRVQSIDITAGLFQRLFGLVKLKIETAGGGAEPEVNLIAISREEAEEISSELTNRNYGHNQSEQVGENLHKHEADYTWRLKTNHLMIAALTSSGLGLTISAVAALFSQIEQFLPETIYDQVFRFFASTGIMLAATFIVVIVFVSWCISFFGTLIKYGGFTIEKFDNELVISRGLLEKRQLTIHSNKVTAIRIVRNIFRQPFGYGAVYVESAGGGTNDEQLSTVLLPIANEQEMIDAFENLIPDYARRYEIKPVPKRSVFRFFIRLSVIPLIATLLIGTIISPYGYYGFIAVVVCLLFGFLQYRDAGSGFDHTHLWLRYRKISQILVISKKKKIQSAEIRSSILQRRKMLANFRFSILSSVIGKTFTVLDIEKKEADKMLDWYSARSDTTTEGS